MIQKSFAYKKITQTSKWKNLLCRKRKGSMLRMMNRKKDNTGLNGREHKVKKVKPKKVFTPGTFPDEISDSSSSDVESDVENM